jgi:DNA gyrase inhibitor GyrI
MLLVVAAIALASILAGPIMSDVEQPKYTVVETYDSIEIRDYAPLIVAEVEVTGPRKDAISQGFRTIADYIFGNNAAASKISMTAPVMQQLRAAPDAKKSEDEVGAWKVRFTMPANYTMATLPKPTNDAVTLKEVKNARFATIRFSGMGDSDRLREKTAELTSFMREHHLKSISQPTYAFYNPPWTIGPLRRNEVLIEVPK